MTLILKEKSEIIGVKETIVVPVDRPEASKNGKVEALLQLSFQKIASSLE